MSIERARAGLSLRGLTRMSVAGTTMGTRFGAVFFADPGSVPGDLADRLQAAVDAVDNQMSTYKPHSDLMKLNRATPGTWHRVPEALYAVIARGLEIGRASAGAFDIGVGEAVAQAGFGAYAQTPQPELFAPASAQTLPRAFEVIALDPDTRSICRQEDVFLDLSGIAKGYGVDRLAEVLEEVGIKRYLVSIDGELRAGKAKPDGSGWVIGVEAPIEGMRSAARLVEVAEVSLATSGDYRHRRHVGQHAFSHTIDPRTGRPLDNRLASVSVLASECMNADALASALMVAGPLQGPEMANALEVPALFMVRDADGGVREIAVGVHWGAEAA